MLVMKADSLGVTTLYANFGLLRLVVQTRVKRILRQTLVTRR
jgi:hypothetical protein